MGKGPELGGRRRNLYAELSREKHPFSAANSMPVQFVLSIQSEVVYGHVGQGAARFALQKQGFEVLALPTVLLSNHPGHGGATGETIPAAKLRSLLQGLAARGIFKDVVAILSGYLGEPAHTEIVAEAVDLVRQKNPKALYLCDPVFGDDNGAYAKLGVAEAMARDLIPIADIVTPNRFELVSLTARQVSDPATAIAAAKALGRPETVVTSVPIAAGQIGAVAVKAGQAWAAGGPKLDDVPNGTGDLLSALYLSGRVKGLETASALGHATGAVHALARRASEQGLKELPLIEYQADLEREFPSAAQVSG
jgi:pyridoxine kinase